MPAGNANKSPDAPAPAAAATAAATSQNNGIAATNQQSNATNNQPTDQGSAPGEGSGAVGAARPAASPIESQQVLDTSRGEGRNTFRDLLATKLGLDEKTKETLRQQQIEEQENQTGPTDGTEVAAQEQTSGSAAPPDDDETPHNADDANLTPLERKLIRSKERYRRERNTERDKSKDLETRLVAALESGQQPQGQQPSQQAAGLPAMPAVAPVTPDPLIGVNDMAQLNNLELSLRALRRQLRDSTEGLVLNQGTAQEKFVTSEEVRKALWETEDALEAVPSRRQMLMARPAWDEKAKAVLPGLFEQNSQDQRAAALLVQQSPQLGQILLNDPMGNYHLAMYLKGFKAAAAETQPAAQTPAPKPNGNGNGNGKITLPPELIAAHEQRENTPYLRQSPPSRPNGSDNATPARQRAVVESTQRVIADGGTPESISRAVVARLNARAQNAGAPLSERAALV